MFFYPFVYVTHKLVKFFAEYVFISDVCLSVLCYLCINGFILDVLFSMSVLIESLVMFLGTIVIIMVETYDLCSPFFDGSLLPDSYFDPPSEITDPSLEITDPEKCKSESNSRFSFDPPLEITDPSSEITDPEKDKSESNFRSDLTNAGVVILGACVVSVAIKVVVSYFTGYPPYF